MKRKSTLRKRLAIASSSALLATHSVNANPFYWDTNGTTDGLGDAGSTWGTNTFGAAMNAGSSRIVINGTLNPNNAANAAANTVYFGTVNMALGSTASTIGIAGGGVSVNRIVFGAGQGTQGVTLSGGGGAITLSNAGASIVANNTGTNTIGAVLNGTNGLLYGGSGTTVLTGTNGFTGGVTVTGGGTLQIGNGTSGSLTSQNLTFHSGGGTFNVRAANAGSTQAMGTLTFTNTGATAGEGTVQSTYGTSGNASLTFSSLATRQGGATGNFIVSGGANGTTNKIVLTGASTGFLDRGLFFGGSSYAAYDATGYVRGLIYGTDANTSAADTIAADTHVQLTTSASNAGISLRSLNLSGGGVDYTVSSGSLTVPGILKTGGGSLSTISGGTSLTTASNAELVVRTDTSTDLLEISTGITGFSGGLTKTGKGSLTLSGSNGYTGVTRVVDGTLILSGGSAIADTQQVLLADAAGAVLKLNSNETVANVYGGGFNGGTVDVQGNTLTYASSTNIAFGGTYTGTSAGAITKQGTGTLTLSNKNTFAGNFNIEGGTLSFTYGNDGTGTLIPLSSGGDINMSNNTTLAINPAANLPNGVIGAQLQANNGGSPAFPYGWTVANDINIASGTSTANITIAGNENAVRFTGNVTGGATGNQTLAITTGNATDRQVVAFSGVIADGSSGTLGLSITSRAANNGSYINLTNNNTFSGPISMTTTNNAPGYLVIGGERYGTAATLVTGSGSLGTGGVYSNTISLTNSGLGVSILSYASSANQTLAGNISGTNGRLLKDGTGILTLSGTNAYTGGSTVSDGTLVFRNTASQSGTGTHAFAAGTTLGLGVGGAGFYDSAAITSAFGSGTILGNVTVTATTNVAIDTTAGDFIHNANIAGNPTKGLTKLGLNALTLGGNNTYTGATTVNAGTLLINGTGSVNASSGIVVNAGGTFLYNSSTALTTTVTLNGSGSDAATFGGSGNMGALALTLDSLDDVLAPGNSPGLQGFTSQTWTSLTYEWELNDWVAMTAGTNFDQINITGSLTLDGSAYALDILSLTTGNVSGDVHNYANSANMWTILTTTTGITGFDASEWTLDTTGFTNVVPPGGSWVLSQSLNGNDLILTYQIPEPSTALLGGLGAFALLLRRRRA